MNPSKKIKLSKPNTSSVRATDKLIFIRGKTLNKFFCEPYIVEVVHMDDVLTIKQIVKDDIVIGLAISSRNDVAKLWKTYGYIRKEYL